MPVMTTLDRERRCKNQATNTSYLMKTIRENLAAAEARVRKGPKSNTCSVYQQQETEKKRPVYSTRYASQDTPIIILCAQKSRFCQLSFVSSRNTHHQSSIVLGSVSLEPSPLSSHTAGVFVQRVIFFTRLVVHPSRSKQTAIAPSSPGKARNNEPHNSSSSDSS